MADLNKPPFVRAVLYLALPGAVPPNVVPSPSTSLVSSPVTLSPSITISHFMVSQFSEVISGKVSGYPS